MFLADNRLSSGCYSICYVNHTLRSMKSVKLKIHYWIVIALDALKKKTKTKKVCFTLLWKKKRWLLIFKILLTHRHEKRNHLTFHPSGCVFSKRKVVYVDFVMFFISPFYLPRFLLILVFTLSKIFACVFSYSSFSSTLFKLFLRLFCSFCCFGRSLLFHYTTK